MYKIEEILKDIDVDINIKSYRTKPNYKSLKTKFKNELSEFVDLKNSNESKEILAEKDKQLVEMFYQLHDVVEEENETIDKTQEQPKETEKAEIKETAENVENKEQEQKAEKVAEQITEKIDKIEENNAKLPEFSQIIGNRKHIYKSDLERIIGQKIVYDAFKYNGFKFEQRLLSPDVYNITKL